MKSVSIRFDDKLLQLAKEQASSNYISFNSFVNLAVEKFAREMQATKNNSDLLFGKEGEK